MSVHYPDTTIETGDVVVRVTWRHLKEAIFERVDGGRRLQLVSLEKNRGTMKTERLPPTIERVDDEVITILETEGFEIVGGDEDEK